MDPNVFPISDLKDRVLPETGVSIWENGETRALMPELPSPTDVAKRVQDRVGFWLEVRPSAIPHMESGRGVFLRTTQRQVTYIY